MRFGWMGMVIYTASDAVATMTQNLPEGLLGRDLTPLDMRNWLLVLIAALGVVATAYTFLGGIRAVVWTDVVQALVMGGGALFVVLYVWNSTGEGPLAWWQQASQQHRAAPILFSSDIRLERTVFLVLLNGFFWRICTHCSDQVATQRYFTVDGARSAVRSNVIGALGDIIIQLLLGMVGLGLVVFFAASIDPANPNDAKEAFPGFILNHMPHGLAGMLMASLFAAAMSSIDSGINSISAVVTVDFFGFGGRRDPSGQDELRIARHTTIVSGIAVTLVAMFITLVIAADPQSRNIIDLSVKVFNVFLGPLGAIFIVGVLLPWVGTAAMNTAAALGILWAVFLAAFEPLTGASPPSALLVIPLSTCGTAVLAAVLGALFPSPKAERIAGHTWWTRHVNVRNATDAAT
jgi:SSS family solute:Na+ symporter